MGEIKEIVSPKHKKLLQLAVWAKYLAWIVLVIGILYSFGRYVEIQNNLKYEQAFTPGQVNDLFENMKQNPIYGLSVIVDVLNTGLQGLVYFLILQGITLGLNMVVETDLNYREIRETDGGGKP